MPAAPVFFIIFIKEIHLRCGYGETVFMDEKEMKNQWEITRAIEETFFYLDEKDPERALKNFTEDCDIMIYDHGKIVSAKSGKKACIDHLLKRMEDMEVLFHVTASQAIDLQVLDQAAVADTHGLAHIVLKEGRRYTEYLSYQDKFIKAEGVWYIVSRTINIVSTVEG
jgi:hypothetical protein